MSDTKDEPTRETQEQPPDTRLAERLLARGTRSLGVIDVRRAEAHYARIMDWLAARTPLLEHLRSRYGLTEAGGARQLGLALADAQGRERAQGTDEGISLSAAPHSSDTPGSFGAPDSFRESAVEQTFTSVAHVTDDPPAGPAETLRIGRRGVPTFSPAGPEPLPDARTHAGRSEGGKTTLEQDSPSPDQARSLRALLPVKEIPAPVKEIPAAPERGAWHTPGSAQTTRPLAPSSSSPPPSTSSLPPSSSLPREAAPSTLGVPTTTAGEAPITSGMRVGKTLPHVRELSVDAGEGLTAPAFAPSGTRRDADLKASDEAATNEAATAEVPLVVELSASSRGAREVSGSVPVVVLERGGASVADGAPEVVSKNLSARAGGGRAFAAGESEVGHAAAETPLPLARARELPAETADGHEAANSGEQSTLPLAASPGDGARAGQTQHGGHAPAAGAAAFEQVSTGVSETFPAGRVRAGERAAEINVERLTEQVSRHLARRLLVERERRGLGRR